VPGCDDVPKHADGVSKSLPGTRRYGGTEVQPRKNVEAPWKEFSNYNIFLIDFDKASREP